MTADRATAAPGQIPGLDAHLRATAVNARFIKPMDQAMLAELVRTHRLIVTVEEGTVVNGFGAVMAETMQREHPDVRVRALGIADELIVQAARGVLYRDPLRVRLAPLVRRRRRVGRVLGGGASGRSEYARAAEVQHANARA